jgi:hypothetical protein
VNIEKHFSETLSSADIVSSTLTLDRVDDPKQLMSNMVALLKRGGFFSIQTLLPISPIDDCPNIIDPIVYTPVPRRISLSSNPEQCKSDLTDFISSLGIRITGETETIYDVSSLDGRQGYLVKCISGLKFTQ